MGEQRTATADKEQGIDLVGLADDMARAARSFVESVQEVAAGGSPDEMVSVLLLDLSSLLAAGAALGAIVDVVPEERFEPDAGYEVDVDLVRSRMRDLLGPADDYSEVFDPYSAGRARRGPPLRRPRRHLLRPAARPLPPPVGPGPRGAVVVAVLLPVDLGAGASAALRALQSLIAHVRLDVPLETGELGASGDDVDPADRRDP